MMAEESPKQKKAERAEMVTPPNRLKEKAGNGGFDEKAVVKAQDQIQNNTVDFKPIATALVAQLDKAVAEARSGAAKGDAALRGIMTPAMQLKAQGAMFHYPLISEISNILVNFLETVTSLDEDALEIITAHRTSINAVLSGLIKKENEREVGKELCSALQDGCDRYARTRTIN
jgi:hypothetical protein